MMKWISLAQLVIMGIDGRCVRILSDAGRTKMLVRLQLLGGVMARGICVRDWVGTLQWGNRPGLVF